MKEHLQLKLLPGDPFAVLWFYLVAMVSSTSVQKYDDIKKRIRSHLPSQHPGEDITQLSLDFCKDASELTVVGHLIKP
jgi:hypothetical protein